MRDILYFTAFIAVLVLMVNAYGRYQCENYESVTGKPTKFVDFDSCYVKAHAG